MNAPEDFANPNTIISSSYLSREKIFRNRDGTYPDKNERFTGYIYTDLKSLPVSILRPSICQIIAPCIDLRLNYKIIAKMEKNNFFFQNQEKPIFFLCSILYVVEQNI